MPRFVLAWFARRSSAAGGATGSARSPLAWQLVHRIVDAGSNAHSLAGEVPDRLSVIAVVWLRPAASIGWYDTLAGLSSVALSSAQRLGWSGSCAGSCVYPE